MSFDDYVNHISKKYRLAIAIAIIKSKPENISTENYIEVLRRKVLYENMDTQDFDLTVCSDDFDIDNDNQTIINDYHDINIIEDNNGNDINMTNGSVTILNDFELLNDERTKDTENKEINEVSHVFRILTEDGESYLTNQMNAFQQNNPSQTDSQMTYYEDLNDNETHCKTKEPNIYIENLGTEFVATNNLAKQTDITKNYKRPSKNLDSESKISRKVKDIDTIDSQETIIYTLYGLTDNYTHVSQSQNENIIITNKYIHGIDKKRDVYNLERDTTTLDFNKTTISQKYIFSQNNSTTQEINYNCTETDNVGYNEQNDEEDISDTQELIPFKVVEELSKVKGFLNKKIDRRISSDGFSTDSGYRSDSQAKNCKNALQLSGSWLNQSGYSLFHFITTCPLLRKTEEITHEISKVLGQLIDKLHDDEMYPSFLEELLESVNLLLRRVYEEDDGSENELQKKDDSIQRLLLLNKSINIQKFCLEKLTDILDEVHTNLTKDEEQYEILNISKIENLSYIFHILEIILKRYVKCKDLSSQSSQTSQDDDKLKRSSITDIWRKKWNPKYKEICIKEGSYEKKCVLIKCSEVLNKIIVNCMGSYSLVAYAALQCFNLLQS